MDSRGTTAALRSNHWRRGVVLAGLVVAAAAALSLGQADRADAAPGTCTKYWKGTASSAWGNAANWSNTNGGASSTVPGADRRRLHVDRPSATATVVVSDAQSVAGINFGSAGASTRSSS